MFQFSKLAVLVSAISFVAAQEYHPYPYTILNHCKYDVTPVIANAAGAVPYTGPQPPTLSTSESFSAQLPHKWSGKVFGANSSQTCGPNGEGCTTTEFSLGDDRVTWAISNVDGFTQSLRLEARGSFCIKTIGCYKPDCDCESAYPVGDPTGCGSHKPLHSCPNPLPSLGRGFIITFCGERSRGQNPPQDPERRSVKFVDM